MASDDAQSLDGTLVRVHRDIGKEGVIVELRPEDHPAPFEQDMQDLTDAEALDLYQQLGDYLAGQGLIDERESEPCEKCGDPIFFDSARAYFKSPDERFWHPDCIPEEHREVNS